jgi:hypothetical protein
MLPGHDFQCPWPPDLTASIGCSSRWCRDRQARLHAQRTRKTRIRIDRRTFPTSLDLADVRLINSCEVGQLLLRQTTLSALLYECIDQLVLELQRPEVSDAGWPFLFRLSLDIEKEIVEIASGLTPFHATMIWSLSHIVK